MRKCLRGYAKDKDGNLIPIGTMPLPHSKDKSSPRARALRSDTDLPVPRARTPPNLGGEMSGALESVCKALNLKMIDDAATRVVAQKIIAERGARSRQPALCGRPGIPRRMRRVDCASVPQLWRQAVGDPRRRAF